MVLKICVYGTGAVGGYLTAKLAATNAHVTCLARGDTLAAIKKNGLKLIENGVETVTRVNCAEHPAEIGPQDYVFLSLKAYDTISVAEIMAPLLGADTSVITAHNGVPWWYFYAHGGTLEGTHIISVDPERKLWNGVGPERVIGCVVYAASEMIEPGVVKHFAVNRFTLGEPDGSTSERMVALSELMTQGGLSAPLTENIRQEIWVKLAANVALNLVGALERATTSEMYDDPSIRDLLGKIMMEAQAVAASLGIASPLAPDQILKGANQNGTHKSSMLQDLERGRPLEIHALSGAVRELAQLSGVDIPNIDIVHHLITLKAQTAGCASAP